MLQKSGGNASLWTVTESDLAAALAETASELRVSVIAFQARDSGPSIDLAWKLPDIKPVQKRARWAAMSSVVRYERHARLATEWAKLQEAAGAIQHLRATSRGFHLRHGEALHMPDGWGY